MEGCKEGCNQRKFAAGCSNLVGDEDRNRSEFVENIVLFLKFSLIVLKNFYLRFLGFVRTIL